MVIGALSYFLCRQLPLPYSMHAPLLQAISIVQPLLIFSMLLLTFCKISFSDLRLSRWQLWGLVLQLGTFLLLSLLVMVCPMGHWQVVAEGAMLCLICPTATAAAVVTTKLGGNAGTLTAYTILINLCVSILVPAIVPLLHPEHGGTFLSGWLTIMGRVFPLLFCPLLLAAFLRRFSPCTVRLLTSIKDLAFYLWAVALALAIAVTTRSLVNSHVPPIYAFAIAAASLLACILQFGVGRLLGRRYGDLIAASQSLGQKNTVFAIWMGYTFLTPISSIAGGFYSIWHNVWNSYQLRKISKQ